MNVHVDRQGQVTTAASLDSSIAKRLVNFVGIKAVLEVVRDAAR